MAQQAAIDGATAVPLVDAQQSLGLAQLDDLFPQGEAFRASLRTFTVLLVLAACIASFGLYQDSVASIIGAMVVAPLGGAILAFAGALVTARSCWQWITARDHLDPTLVATGAQKAFESARAVTAEPYVRAWIGGRNLTIADWSIDGDSVTLDLTGPDAPGDAQVLASELAAAYGSPVTLMVNYVPTQQDVATGTP
jgi:hypothetical protein